MHALCGGAHICAQIKDTECQMPCTITVLLLPLRLNLSLNSLASNKPQESSVSHSTSVAGRCVALSSFLQIPIIGTLPH